MSWVKARCLSSSRWLPPNLAKAGAASDFVRDDQFPCQADGGVVAILNLGPSGLPRLYSIIYPTAGVYTATDAGLSTGPYTLQGYLADTSIGGTRSTTDGFVHANITKTRSFTVTLPLTLQWQPSANSARVYLPIVMK